MKQRNLKAERLEKRILRLCEALLAMRTPGEMRALLEDLTTPAELEALADRLRVAEALAAGLPYRDIHDETGVSVTTVTRVSRCVRQGTGGYRRALRRLGAGPAEPSA